MLCPHGVVNGQHEGCRTAPVDIAWDYPNCGPHALTWPHGMPIPHVGDYVYNDRGVPFRVQRVAYRPAIPSVYIVCEEC